MKHGLGNLDLPSEARGPPGVSMRRSSWLQTLPSAKPLSKAAWEQAERACLRNLQGKKMCLCWKNTPNILTVPAALTLHLVQGA